MNESSEFLLIASSMMQRTPAFDRAVALAKAYGAPLRIVALDYFQALEVMGIFDHSALSLLRDGYLQAHGQWLEQQVAQERAKGLECKVEVLWTDSCFEAIIACVRAARPQMLIKDVHHEPLFARLFSTPLDWHLLRDCLCPVQLVTGGHSPLPRKVLVAVNLYRYEDADLKFNDRLIETASRIARQCGGSVHVLYSYDWSVFYATNVTLLGALPVETGFHEALGEAHAEAFASLCDRHAIPAECCHFLVGTPQPTISAFAREQDIDLLVMGSLPRTRLEKVIGNTAESLLIHSPCSVLIIKPGDDPDESCALSSANLQPRAAQVCAHSPKEV
ncbi:universal stress protein [Pseudomonas sp. Pseusp122]|uniref:universal stress protein n=1 Tax=unclassified Pseudomonas TaxID=196821 RepID=UPI0039A58CC1